MVFIAIPAWRVPSFSLLEREKNPTVSRLANQSDAIASIRGMAIVAIRLQSIWFIGPIGILAPLSPFYQKKNLLLAMFFFFACLMTLPITTKSGPDTPTQAIKIHDNLYNKY